MPVHADMARLLGNALEPAAHGRKAGKIETAFVGNMGEGVECDVRNGVAASSKKAMVFEVLFHYAQRLISLLHPLLDGMDLKFASTFDEHKPEMGGAYIWLKAVLFKEHPLQHLGAIESVRRHERRALGEIPQDGTGFRQIAAGRSFEQRDVPTRVLGEELWRVSIALENVDLHQ